MMNTAGRSLDNRMLLYLLCCVISTVTACKKQDAEQLNAPAHPSESSQHQADIETSSSEDAKEVDVVETYTGICLMDSSDPEDPSEIVKQFIIYNQLDFEEFINSIPESLPSKTNPPPKNDDKLLGKPKLDFEKNIAIVLLNPDTLSSIPEVLSISEDAETRWIEVEYPAKPIGESFPYGTGTYRIAIIPFSGEKKKTYFDIDAD